MGKIMNQDNDFIKTNSGGKQKTQAFTLSEL